VLRRHSVTKTFCRGDVMCEYVLFWRRYKNYRRICVTEKFCNGDVLSRRRYARRCFVCAPCKYTKNKTETANTDLASKFFHDILIN
jgi:hypothetical protein